MLLCKDWNAWVLEKIGEALCLCEMMLVLLCPKLKCSLKDIFILHSYSSYVGLMYVFEWNCCIRCIFCYLYEFFTVIPYSEKKKLSPIVFLFILFFPSYLFFALFFNLHIFSLSPPCLLPHLSNSNLIPHRVSSLWFRLSFLSVLSMTTNHLGREGGLKGPLGSICSYPFFQRLWEGQIIILT